MKIRVLLLCALAALTGMACSSSSTGPQVSAGGQWQLEANSLAGDGETCQLVAGALILIQDGSAVRGQYAYYLSPCADGNGDTTSGGPYMGNVVNGQITGSSLTFDLGNTGVQMTGTVSSKSMTGTAVVTTTIGPPAQVVTLTGTWTARRLD